MKDYFIHLLYRPLNIYFLRRSFPPFMLSIINSVYFNINTLEWKIEYLATLKQTYMCTEMEL